LLETRISSCFEEKSTLLSFSFAMEQKLQIPAKAKQVVLQLVLQALQKSIP